MSDYLELQFEIQAATRELITLHDRLNSWQLAALSKHDGSNDDLIPFADEVEIAQRKLDHALKRCVELARTGSEAE